LENMTILSLAHFLYTLIPRELILWELKVKRLTFYKR